MLGAGGFAITYLAEHVAIRNLVALKEFLPAGIAARAPDGTVRPLAAGKSQDFAWGLERFRDEARTLGRLKHPNIVPVLNFIEANRTAYAVMEFVAGETLAERLDRTGLLAHDELAPLLPGLFAGIAAVHEAGFLHRDLKPANIVLRALDHPVLIDFGAARLAFNAHSRSLTAILSDGYSPYEQYQRSGDQGAWTDIYALGATLYTSVTGEKPPDATRRVGARFRGTPDPLVPASRFAAGRYPPELLAAIDRAMALVESERPQSVAEFAALAGIGAPPATTEASRPSARDDTLIAGGLDSRLMPTRREQGAVFTTRPRRRFTPMIAAAGAVAVIGAAAGGYISLTAPTPPQTSASAGPSQGVGHAANQELRRSEASAEERARSTAREDLARGIAASGTAAFDEAVASLSRAIASGKLAPADQARALLARSAAWVGKSDYTRAADDASEAIRVDPANADAYRERGRLAVYRQDWDAAMADFDEAVRRAPDVAENYTWRGLVSYHRGDADRALADYNEALRLKPDFADARFQRGLAWLKKGDRARAIEDFQVILNAGGNSAVALNARRMLVDLGQAP